MRSAGSHGSFVTCVASWSFLLSEKCIAVSFGGNEIDHGARAIECMLHERILTPDLVSRSENLARHMRAGESHLV